LRRKKTGFEIAKICGGFGHIQSILLLKRIYEGRVNLNPLTPKEDDRNANPSLNLMPNAQVCVYLMAYTLAQCIQDGSNNTEP
jgi:hypothetical protein